MPHSNPDPGRLRDQVGPGPVPGPEVQGLQGCTALGPRGPRAPAHDGPESMRTWGLGPWIMGPWLPVCGPLPVEVSSDVPLDAPKYMKDVVINASS